MTSALWKSINIKNQLYKKWIKTNVNNVELYSRLKGEFKSYYNTLRRSIREAKRLYYTRTFTIYKINIKQTWTIIKDTLQIKSKCEIPNQFFIGNRMLKSWRSENHTPHYYWLNQSKYAYIPIKSEEKIC